MATRGQQLIRTDDSQTGVVKFYRRDIENAVAAFIAKIDVNLMLEDAGIEPADVPKQIIAAAIHGYTQNMLDSSNKLDGNDRVNHIRKQCDIVQAGGWASAPVDAAAQRTRAIEALMKMDFTREEAEAAVDKKGA